MSSVSFVNPALDNLFQRLTGLKVPAISSPAAVSALGSAPTADVVQLSAAVSQLEAVDAMFGISTAATDDMGSSLMATLLNSASPQPAPLSESTAERTTDPKLQPESDLAKALFGSPEDPPGSFFQTVG